MGFLHQPYLVTSKQVLIHKGAFVRGEDELGGDGVGVFEKEFHELAHQGRMQATLHLVDEENFFALDEVEDEWYVVEDSFCAVAFVVE